MSIIDNPNLDLRVFTDFAGGRDDLGAAFQHHTQSDRASFLKRNPTIDPATLPPVRDPAQAQHMEFGSVGSVHGLPLRTPARIRYEAAALLADPAATLARHEPTKPRAATESSRYRLCLHEGAHASIASLAFGRPIVRVTIEPNGELAGHTWHYHEGDANRDTMVIVAAGRIAEEILLGDVYEAGCSGDDETLRKLALRLADGNADALIAEAQARARVLVKQYAKTIRRFALRLAAKREFVLDLAEAAIRLAHEEVTRSADVETEWQTKLAYARARQSVREYVAQRAAPTAKVIRTYDCGNKADVVALLKKFPGLGNVDYSVREGE
jgi:hypothetical protein